MLSEIGLNETLGWLCKEFSILHKIPCKFETAYKEDDLTEEMQIDFFRICQESLHNVALHARAKTVLIKMERLDGSIRLSVIDDGVGFDVATQEEKFGFTSMRERASSINGRLQVHSVFNQGTRVSVSVDLPAYARANPS